MRSLGKNIAFKFILNIFNVGIPIIVGPYLVRKLGANMIGNFNFAQSVYNYFYIFANFGVYQFAVRELSRVRDDESRLSSIFTNLFCVTTITTLITLCAYIMVINKFYANDTVLYYIFLVLTVNFFSNVIYIEWANEALENYDFITVKTVVIKTFYTILIFLLVRNIGDYKIYAKLLVFSTFLNNIVSYIYIKKRIKFNFKNLHFTQYLKPMFWVVLISNANILFTQLDILLIGHFVNKTEVAFYSGCNTIMIMCNTIMISIVSVTLPRVSNYLANDDDKKYLEVINKISKVFFMLMLPMSVGLFVLSDKIMLLYGGSEFYGVGRLFRIFCIYMISIGFEYILANQVIYIHRRDKSLIKMIFTVGVINVLFKILLFTIGKFNPYTAIITTLISNTILVILEYAYVKKELKLKIELFSKVIIKYFVIALSFIPINIVISMLIKNYIVNMAVTIIVCIMLYFILLNICKDDTYIFLRDKFKAKIYNKLNRNI